MAVSTDVFRTWRVPRRVMRTLLAMGQREDRAIAYLMIGCLVLFISRLPALQRIAVLEDGDFTRDASYAFFGVMMILPLIFYGIAALSRLLMRALGGQGTWYGARLALFWALLASTPMALFHGLLQGLNGDTPATQLIGVLWFAGFVVIWVQSLREAEVPTLGEAG